MKNKPDDRADNVDRIQRNINYTIHNIELGEELIEKTHDEEMRKDIMAKNERREHALEAMREEIKDEAIYQEQSEEE